jgi:hypothetical protein
LGWFEGTYARAVCATETAYNEVAGTVSHEYDATAAAIQAGYTVATDELRRFVDGIPDHIAHATNWPELKYWAQLALGYESFQVGVGVGLAEGLVGAVVDIAKLAISLVKLQMKIWQLQKTFILAALYEQAHADGLAAVAQNPLTYPVAKAANWVMGKELETAHQQVRAMMEQLQRLLQHPSPDFKKLFNEMLSAMGRGKDSVIAGWKHYTELLKDTRPSAKFEAGVMTGKVLFEVIMLILMIISVYGAAAEAGTAIARAAGRFMARFAEEFPALYEFIVGARDVAEVERVAALERAAAAERAATAERAAAGERAATETKGAGTETEKPPESKREPAEEPVPERMPEKKLPCFKPEQLPASKMAEMDRQLVGQEAGLNKMTVQEYLDGRDAYKLNGRGDPAVAREARAQYQDRLEQNLIRQGMDPDDAAEEASKAMNTLAALHNPDQVAGGANVIGDFGDSEVNSTIGRNWSRNIPELGKSRIQVLDEAANAVPAGARSTTLMNARLQKCP